MSEHLKRIIKDGIERDYGEVVHTEKVAHVTFYITKDEVIEDYNVEGTVMKDYYHVYSESEKLGFHPIDSFEYQQLNPGSHEDALVVLRMEIQKLEEILERKRSGIPTPKQVYFLFREKIPIPIDLTWGQASDLIDERLSQKEYEKEAWHQKQLAKFNGFEVGMTVFQPHERYIGIGKITKLTSNNKGSTKYAYVKWENKDYTSRVTIDSLYKTQDEAMQVQQFTHGDRVHHTIFGDGVVFFSRIVEGRELVGIRFDKPMRNGSTEGSFYSHGIVQKISLCP